MNDSRCRIDDDRRDLLAQKYTALHEGRTLEELLCEEWQSPRGASPFGVATEIQYKKKVPEGKPSYHHPWEDYAQPTIAVDKNGQLVFYAGKYETTRRGIEDRVLPGMPTVEYLKQPYVQPEKLPGPPKELITLGTLEWIGYKVHTSDGWKNDRLVFNPSIAPEIAHDQDGNLHVLHGRYLITDTGVEESMKHARRHHMSYDNPRRGRSRRARRRHFAYNNPTRVAVAVRGETGAQRAGRMIMNSVVVGGVATLTAVGMNMALARVAWSGGVKAATKIGVGLVGGLGLAYLLPTVPSVAAGFSVGGVIDGFLDLWNMYVAPRLTAMTTSTTTTTTTTQTPAPTGTLPAGQAMFGGIPRQYAGYSPAACGVGY